MRPPGCPKGEPRARFWRAGTSTRALAGLALLFTASIAGAQTPFSFAVFGDTPYHPLEVPAVRQLLLDVDRAGMAFVVNIGDIKRASEPCSNDVFRERHALLDASPRPLVFTPGDNEWTDCYSTAAGEYDPRERLDALRVLFFASDESLGQTRLRVTRQSDDPRFRPYRENARWIAGGVVFATFNVPGGNNNLMQGPAKDDETARRASRGFAEHAARMAANFAWLAEAVELARQPSMRGLAIFAHADPLFGNQPGSGDGYEAWRQALRLQAAALGKAMLFVHGDGHRYRVDQPLTDPVTFDRLTNLTRVEVFGSPTVGWVRVDVTPESERVFAISPGQPTP
jgi:hypothetical protein